MSRIIRKSIFSEELKMKFREKEKDFTRNRKQGFPEIILFLLNNLRRSLSIEIDGFISHLNAKISDFKMQDFTKSAFVQSRNKLKPEVFMELSNIVNSFFYDKNNEADIKTFQGKNILAVDGSDITLPDTSLLRELFGESKNQSETSVCKARISVLYDVLNKLVLDANIGNLSIGERELATSHFEYIKPNDLVIYDRGYPSYDFIYQHINLKCDYLFRVKTTHSNVVKEFYESKKRSQIIEIYPIKNHSFENKDYDKNQANNKFFKRSFIVTLFYWASALTILS